MEKLRDNGRMDIGLRAYGGQAKSENLGEIILAALAEHGSLEIGDKSSPEAISEMFPGTSKSAFKKAVSMLYRQGKVQPGPQSISLMNP